MRGRFGSHERALMPRETLPRKFGKGRDTLAKPSPGDKIFSYECILEFCRTVAWFGRKA